MSTKAVNRLFLVSLLVEAAVILFLSIAGIQLNIIVSIIVPQLIMLVPAICFLVGTKTKPGFIAHKRMHPTTPFLCIVYTGLSMPLIMVVNMISMLFVENRANQMAYEMMDMPWWLMILIVGILGPVNEEFIYRGVYYHSYKATGRILAAMFMSAFLFGVMHMNFNQMSYAIVVGILAVLLVEATGSIVSSMIFHACINTYNVVIMLIQRKQLAASGGDTQVMVEDMLAQIGMSYDRFLIVAIVIYGMIAVATTTLAVLLVFGIAAIEKRTAVLKGMFRRQEQTGETKKKSLWTVPLVIGVVGSFVYMIAMG